jgi:uncharacterized protein
MREGPGSIDLERLALRSGQARTLELPLQPDSPMVGGVSYPLVGGGRVPARVEVSRTTGGFALRLLASVTLTGPCARCLEPARLEVPVGAREVEQSGSDDPELSSPYVQDGVLDATSWLHDVIILALPEKILCRPGCAGICEVCGASLNEIEGAEHAHEPPPDPRFAKLRELLEPDADPGEGGR